MAGRKPSARALRREQERLVRDLERLAELEPGGAAVRPLSIESPAQVEVIATARPCPLCAGTLHLEAHEVETVEGALLRVARLVCTLCGVRRRRWFRLQGRRLN